MAKKVSKEEEGISKMINEFKFNADWAKKSYKHMVRITCDTEKEMIKVKKYYDENMDEKLLRQVEFRVV